MIYEIVGSLGLVFIIIGVVLKNREYRDIFYVIGGILLAIYSFSIGNYIFITLQIIFTLVAIYDLIKVLKKVKHKKSWP